ncbi:hypothetical protein [Eggerthia catenaformis]|uniref:hypothetical protein n=1 Tax=Eggerthia catenaformis TaxID=31973 RepID=UPI0028F03B3B|nr:hypothetical protein [Eggerthia catenaformis]
MKKRYKVAFICSSLIIIGSYGLVHADNIVNGTSWQSADYVNVPKHGGTKYNTWRGSKKVTTSRKGSFKASYGAWLDPYARLITKSKADRSYAEKLSNSSTIHPELYQTARKNQVFYTKVSTNIMDPGYIEVSLDFSSDYID